MRWWFLGLVGTAVTVAIACESRLPTPKYTRQPTSALSPVPYPPPPARAETIPKQPQDGAVWIDGEWVWQTRRWAWRKGRWIVPPAGAKFAPWTSVRDPSGTLYVATGVWRNANGDEVPEPPAIEQGKPRGAGDIVLPDNDVMPVGAPASSAAETFTGREQRRGRQEAEALDASGPPKLENDAAVTEQLLDASAMERAPSLDASAVRSPEPDAGAPP